MLSVIKPRCEYFNNPIGLGAQNPRFSWILKSDCMNVIQAGYQIQVSENDDSFRQPVWDSGLVPSDRSVNVKYDGPALKECTHYCYRIRVNDNHSQTSSWSETAFFETGIFDESSWKAEFITPSVKPAGSEAYLFRKEFEAGKEIASAKIYGSSLGMYEFRINGQKVGDTCLTPGWTNYKKRLQYQTYDVTDMLKKGTNVIGAILGPGWFKSEFAGWKRKKLHYGDTIAVIIQMDIKYTDGSCLQIITDEHWKSHASPITMAEIYHGESYDARLESTGWDTAGFDDSAWLPVITVPCSKSILVAQENYPVRKHETIKPVEMFTTPAGEVVLDMGQNMVGWIGFRVSGKAGEKVILKHAEVLDIQGNFYTENLRTARQTIEYTLKGEAEEYYEPHFTFMGFRYVKIEEYPGEINPENFSGYVLHSDMEPTGEFECSDELLNKLQHNILWGLKGNFVDIPTDCPQRDERLGWTGDAQVFIRTANFLMNTAPFFTKWLRDIKSEQTPEGGIPFVIPNVLEETAHSSSGWGDAAVICPWTVYLSFGDKNILADQYESMKAWVEYIRSQAQNGVLWNSGFHFGDWLGLDAKEGSYTGATDKALISTAFYAYSCSLLAKAARLIGNVEDEKAYAKLHSDIRAAYIEEFYTPSGRLAVPTQTAHVLSLYFELAPEKHIKRTMDDLVGLLEQSNWHLTTGFLGTPYLCHVLSSHGRSDIAYKLLMQTDYPSWLYPITKGATTIWEHWDGIKPDGTFWSKNMNSFNHYAYGAIGDWMYRVIAGIDTDEDKSGYKRIIIKPTAGGGLQYAKASLQTMYGKVSSAWSIEDNKIRYKIEIPHNTTACLILPVDRAAGRVEEIELGSGNYEFDRIIAEE